MDSLIPLRPCKRAVNGANRDIRQFGDQVNSASLFFHPPRPPALATPQLPEYILRSVVLAEHQQASEAVFTCTLTVLYSVRFKITRESALRSQSSMFDNLRVFFVRAVLVPFVLACVSLAQNGEPPAVPLYLDPAQPIAARVDDLISRMTLEEKASQLVNQARAIPRLQVPQYDWWSEALHGVASAGTATVFPEPIGLAATFDAPLIHEMAVVIGTEARAKHNQAVRAGRRDIMEGLDFWSPNINIFRDPRWGRGQETYGEDPFLTGRMGVAFVTGMQGDDPKYFRVISTPKHFAVHSGPEPSRHIRSTWRCRSTIWRTRICPPSAPPLPRAKQGR